MILNDSFKHQTGEEIKQERNRGRKKVRRRADVLDFRFVGFVGKWNFAIYTIVVSLIS